MSVGGLQLYPPLLFYCMFAALEDAEAMNILDNHTLSTTHAHATFNLAMCAPHEAAHHLHTLCTHAQRLFVMCPVWVLSGHH